jgi:hypothetical protein
MSKDALSLDDFLSTRSKPLQERFPGHYRAKVVETNDPLNIGRVRFLCPELHDATLSPTDAQWAVPAFKCGGGRSGSFGSPCIGDWIWITFEKQHPYGPIWIGSASPTRRRQYAYAQVSQPSIMGVNSDGQALPELPDDFAQEYLPLDGRPMTIGTQDRYGNMDLMAAVGFYPTTHAHKPPPPDFDPIKGTNYAESVAAPRINQPDRKYMVRVTKYGMTQIQSDQGYFWRKQDDDSNIGEFYGDPEKDEAFEVARWKNLQRLLNCDVPDSIEDGGDHRRQANWTRYGHLWEQRDVGWAQLGPIPSLSRAGDPGPAAHLSLETTRDERWIKWRTKGGHLLQGIDVGCHPAEDKFVTTPLLEDIDRERESTLWKDKDMRGWRMLTRHGFKLALDDRGSDIRDADGKESPHGNGILLKGRRSSGAMNVPVSDADTESQARGFFFEFNENDAANHTSWGTPNGLTMEMNDRYQYVMLAGGMGPEWAAPFRGLEENEFIRKPTMMTQREFDTTENEDLKVYAEKYAHHLKLDHHNEYVRLKTRANRGTAPLYAVNPVRLDEGDLNQGFEARDGSRDSGAWVEMVDSQARGVWLSRNQQLVIIRASSSNRIYQWFDERRNQLVLYNGNPSGRVTVFATGNVDVIADGSINLKAANNINLQAGGRINMVAGTSNLSLTGAAVSTSNRIHASKFDESPLADGTANVATIDKPTIPDQVEPDDRGKTYNGPFEECPTAEVEHKVQAD